MVSGEDYRLKQEMALFPPPFFILPPQAFSNTLHPQDQTPPASGSHILMNAEGEETQQHIHLAQNGPNCLGLKPLSFSKAERGISPTFPNPALKSCQTTCREQWGHKTICEWFQGAVVFHMGFNIRKGRLCGFKHLFLTTAGVDLEVKLC